jgi:hypothetical protein
MGGREDGREGGRGGTSTPLLPMRRDSSELPPSCPPSLPALPPCPPSLPPSLPTGGSRYWPKDSISAVTCRARSRLGTRTMAWIASLAGASAGGKGRKEGGKEGGK